MNALLQRMRPLVWIVLQHLSAVQCVLQTSKPKKRDKSCPNNRKICLLRWFRLINGDVASRHQTIGEFMSNSLFLEEVGTPAGKQKSHLFFIMGHPTRQPGVRWRDRIYWNYRGWENESLRELAGVKHGRRDIICSWELSPDHLWRHFTRMTGGTLIKTPGNDKSLEDVTQRRLEDTVHKN